MDDIEKYIIERSTPEDTLLAELDRETNLRVVQPRMISGHVQGRLLEMIVKMINPQNVLEIGTFTGYSTLCIAAGLKEGGTIDTIEVNDELESFAQSFFARSPHRDKINQHIGSVLEIAPKLGKVYDMVFIDGDKREYRQYFKMLMGDSYNGGIFTKLKEESREPLVKSGSIIIADNILWYGKVAQPIVKGDRYTQELEDFNRMVFEDSRVENIILPIRDGLNLIRVK